MGRGRKEKLKKRRRRRENGRWRVRICARGPAVAQPRATIREPRPSSRLTRGTASSAPSAAPAPPPQPSRLPSREHCSCGRQRCRTRSLNQGMPSAALCVLGDAEGPSPGARWCLTRDMRGRRGRKPGGGGGTQSRGCEPGEKGKGRAGLAEGGGEQKKSMGETKCVIGMLRAPLSHADWCLTRDGCISVQRRHA